MAVALLHVSGIFGHLQEGADLKLSMKRAVRQITMYRGADKSLSLSERKQFTATKDSDFHISYS
jgi:hypothetical protein